ncbi:MAG: CapA family protein [Terracidiphilus sp.]|jgi:poly-gamma-glutamate synthesis protein (capsule biosynthesis protein)
MNWVNEGRRFGSKFGAGPAAKIGSALRKHWRLAGVAALLLGSAAGVALLSASHGARPAAVVVPYPHELAQVSFAVAGDVIPHEQVRAAAAAAGDGAQGWAALFSDVSDVFEKADFGFVNLETPVAPAHSHGSKPFMFDAPVALLDGLKASGIKIVSFANNHVMDQGWAGFAETREHLREQGLLFVGSGDTAQQAWQPVVVEASGIKVGWLGMTRWLNGNRNPEKDDLPHVNFFPYPNESGGAPGMDEVGVIEAIKQARAQCDLLVVSIHWGIEYAPAPRPEDVEAAHKMLEAGASVIVGHHPHVLEPVETYTTQDGRDTVIFYSLGNFLSNQSRTYVDGLMPDKNGDPRDEMIGLFSAVRKDYGPAGVRVELGHVGILPVWGENNRNELASGRTKTAVIRPILIDREIPRLQARLDELNKIAELNKTTEANKTAESSKANPPAAPLTADQRKEFIAVTKRLKLLTDRRVLILGRVGDEYVTDPPKLSAKP